MNFRKPGTAILDRFEVIGPPLQGAFGTVYFCIDLKNNRPVALKTFKSEFLSDRTVRDLFLRECTAWVEIGQHPNIVRCYQVKHNQSETFLVLELIAKEQGREGASLRDWIYPGYSLPVDQALLFALQIARGMQHAVEKIPGFVHRDLKPENVLVGADRLPGTNINRVRVTDFGLARVSENQLLPASQRIKPSTGEIYSERSQWNNNRAGTYLYMAPEQWRNEPVGVFTDVYALGCILYEMLTGNSIIDMDGMREVEEIEAAHCQGKLRRLPDWMQPDLKKLIQFFTATDPLERVTDWNTVAEILSKVYLKLSGLPVPPCEFENSSITERVSDGWSYNAIGKAYLEIGKSEVAIEYFRKSLSLVGETGDRYCEIVALGSFGSAYWALGNARLALEYCNKALTIAQMIGSKENEGTIIGNIGLAYAALGDVQQAIIYYEQYLSIAHEFGDRRGEGNALGSLGEAYRVLGKARQAIEYFEKYFAITNETGDLKGNGAALNDLGLSYADIGDTRQAIGYYEQALTIWRKIGNLSGEGTVLGNLGIAYAAFGDFGKAIMYYEQALVIRREIGDRRGIGHVLNNTGEAYRILGDVRQAIEYYEQALAIALEIGDRLGEGSSLGNLGTAYLNMGNAIRGISYFEKRLKIAREIGDLQGESIGSWNLGLAYEDIGEFDKAIIAYQVCVNFERSIGHPDAEVDAAKVNNLRLQIKSNMAGVNPSQAAFDAFMSTNNPQYMQDVVNQYPLLRNSQFIQFIKESIIKQDSPDNKFLIEVRLNWLLKIVDKIR